jgi:hypothetical protein
MTSNQPPQPLSKYCILCVDNDNSGLGLRAALLEDEGYFMTAVSCPLMALEHDVSQFHLAILDFQSTEQLKCTRSGRSTYIPQVDARISPQLTDPRVRFFWVFCVDEPLGFLLPCE